jgi:preprotein translocase subunit SecD
MKNNRVTFLFVIAIFLIALLINIPKSIPLNVTFPAIPGVTQEIRIQKTFPGFNPNFKIGNFQFQKDLAFKKGLDLEGGTSVTLKANMDEIPSGQRDNALASAKEVIERRINFFGVSEPVIQTSKANDEYRIIVEIPGISDVNQAVQLIGQTAKLTFWEAGASVSAEASLSASLLPLGVPQLLGVGAEETDLSGSDLASAIVSFDPNTGKPQVQLNFTPDGTEKFADITTRNTGKIVAIVLDDQVVEAPRVNEPITAGSAVISGNFTTEQANQLTIQLNAGALPVSLSVLEQRGIGATLGQVSLEKSLFAGILGFVVIVLFMSSLYGRLGVIASLALVVYTLITLALFRIIPITLTLAGIAGFILSIGIAVDANILIFERMKEEMRLGKTREMALKIGFSRAWSSIRDSNIASLITSGILYYFGTGIVRGFALTLALGVLVSMFSAITVTRTLLRVLYRDK